MEFAISVLIIVFGALVAVSVAALLVVEMTHKADQLSERFPTLGRLIERRKSHGTLLLACTLLLVGNGFEVMKKEVPEVPAPPVMKIAAPIAPQVNNQSRVVTHVLPAPKFETQISHWENFVPSDPRYGSGLRVTVVTEKKQGSVQLLIVCNGEILQIPKSAKSSRGKMFVFESQELLKSHPDVFNVKWRTPEWTPDDPIVFEFLSRNEIHPKWVIPISYNPNN